MQNEELIQAIRDSGDENGRLKLQLWEQNKGLIQKACKKYKGYLETEDAEQECYFAFTAAVSEYNADGTASFATFLYNRCAWHLYRYLSECGYCVRMPEYHRQNIQRYKAFTTQYYQACGYLPGDADTCAALNVSQDQLEQIRASENTAYVKSIDAAAFQDDEQTTLADAIPGESAAAEEEAIDRLYKEERARAVWDAVDTLRPQDGEAIRLYYQDGKTYAEIGEAMGETGDRVRVLLSRGLRQLRTGKKYRVLRDFIDLSPTYSVAISGGNAWMSSTERAAFNNLLYEERRRADLKERLDQAENLRKMLFTGESGI